MEILGRYSYINKQDRIFISKSLYPSELGEHAHEFLEIVYVFSGIGIHCINGREHNVTKGDLFLLDYNDSHTFKNTSPDFTIITCAFIPQLIDDTLVQTDNAIDILYLLLSKTFFEEHSDLRFSMNLINRQKEFERIFDEMYLEFTDKKNGYQSVLRGYLIILLSRIFRSVVDRTPQIDCRRQMEIIVKAVEYLKDNYSKPIKVEDIARLVLLSPNYFAAVFKSETGRSLTDYLHDLRVSEACSLLIETNKSINAIMNEVGYSDSKFFYSIFKRYTGMTPGEYRKRIHQ